MFFIRWLTFPFALIYALVVYLRNWLYDVGFFKSYSFKVPIVCVGNLSVGGTGKTPMADFLLNGLKENHKIAVLSRGYRRKSKGFLLAGYKSTVTDLGDEPYQLHKKHPNVALAVDADRVNGINTLLKETSAEVILMDDAFQHRRVKPSFSMVLTTYEQPFPKDFYLPFGNLRDAKNQYKRADVLVVTKCPRTITNDEMDTLKSLIKPVKKQLLLFAYLQYSKHFMGKDKSMTSDELSGKNIALVTGIANPKPLVRHLKSQGLNFRHHRYADHHFFSEQELNLFKNYDIVLTTEKDFTRLEEHIDNAYYLAIEHKFVGDGASNLTQLIKERIRLDFQLST